MGRLAKATASCAEAQRRRGPASSEQRAAQSQELNTDAAAYNFRMLNSSRSALVFALAAASLCGATFVVSGSSQTPAPKQTTEKHLANIKQLTHGGENAEAYFSQDGSHLIFQSTRAGYACDQIYTIKIDGTDERRVSNGTGRTTCGYYYPGREVDSLRVDS